MDSLETLKQNIEIIKSSAGYTLLKIKDATYQPYVVAWNFNTATYQWDQGFYSSSEEQAVDLLNEVSEG